MKQVITKEDIGIILLVSTMTGAYTFGCDLSQVAAWQEKALRLYYSWQTSDLQAWFTAPTGSVALDVWLGRITSLVNIALWILSGVGTILMKRRGTK
jgi:hypothetical protein